MAKRTLGPTTNLFPMPALLVVVKTGEGPEGVTANVMTAAWAGIVSGGPPTVAVQIGKNHYTTPHLEREGAFSLNVPRAEQYVGTDYCGMVSGRLDGDKIATCGWSLTPARLIGAPLIAECPLSFECRVTNKVAVGAGAFYLAEIVETHADESVLIGDTIDARALDPLVFTSDGFYHRLGERLGKAWDAGKALEIR